MCVLVWCAYLTASLDRRGYSRRSAHFQGSQRGTRAVGARHVSGRAPENAVHQRNERIADINGGGLARARSGLWPRSPAHALRGSARASTPSTCVCATRQLLIIATHVHNMNHFETGIGVGARRAPRQRVQSAAWRGGQGARAQTAPSRAAGRRISPRRQRLATSTARWPGREGADA
jgi:hypothetical protein